MGLSILALLVLFELGVFAFFGGFFFFQPCGVFSHLGRCGGWRCSKIGGLCCVDLYGFQCFGVVDPILVDFCGKFEWMVVCLFWGN